MGRDLKRTNSDGVPASRIRAIRFQDNQKECEHRLSAFGLFWAALDVGNDSSLRTRIARALRSERRAARAGGPGYDPMRHLVLARLDRRMQREWKTAR